MHGENRRLMDNSSEHAGTFIHIHNNDIHYGNPFTGKDIVGISGRPRDIAIVENNCVANWDNLNWIVQEFEYYYNTQPAGGPCAYNPGIQKWSCVYKNHYPNLRNIIVRNNRLQTASGCADR